MLYGFDVGGTKIAFAVYDLSLRCVHREQFVTPKTHHQFIALIKQSVFQADARFDCQGGVGIGFPGRINADTQHVECANVGAIKAQPLAKQLSHALLREVKLENDANCFLLSECHKGCATGCDTVLAVTLGTGVGGAVFANGDVLRGQNGFAGEIGHYPLPATLLRQYPDLPDISCPCGRQMCLEGYASGSGLSNLYQHHTQQRLTGEQIIKRYRAGEVQAIATLHCYFDILAAGLGTAMLVLDADAIVLGGGLSKLDILLEALQQRLPDVLLPGVKLPRLLRAKFGPEGGARGAALLNYNTVNAT